MTNLASTLFRAYVFERIEEIKRDLSETEEALAWRMIRELNDDELPGSYTEMLAHTRRQGEVCHDPRCFRKGPVFGTMLVFAETADCEAMALAGYVGMLN